MPSVTNVEGLLQITEVNLQSSFKIEKVLLPYDCAYSHSKIPENRVTKLNIPTLKLTVHEINSHQTIDAQCRVEVDTISFGWLLLVFCRQVACEERIER